jgi:hypothetical protein
MFAGLGMCMAQHLLSVASCMTSSTMKLSESDTTLTAIQAAFLTLLAAVCSSSCPMLLQ